MRSVVVDNRWSGNHGIGRYAREIISRLNGRPFQLYQGGSPLSLPNTAIAAVSNLGAFSYTPGFNIFNANPARAIITVHDLTHIDYLPYRSRTTLFYYEHLIKPTCRRAPFVFTGSCASRARLAQWANIELDKIIVTGNGVSDAFSIEGNCHQPGYPYFLCVGSSRPHKNTDLLIEAFLRARIPPEYRLLLAGSYNQQTRSMASQRLVFLEDLSDASLAEVYRGSVGLIQPSLFEGFGLPLAEALACGCPLLAADTPVFHEVAGQSAVYFDPSSAAALATAIEDQAQLPHRPQAERAGKAIQATYSWDKVAAIVREKLLSLL